MSKRDIIVIGTSAGGMETLTELFSRLPKKLAASIFVVCHVSPYSPGVLPKIISRASNLPATHAADREPIKPGQVYVAPPDHHLLIEDSMVRVTQGPKENRFRPAIDPLFRSAAYAYGPRVIGVILTGALDDGTAGLWAVKERGGLAVVQDPDDALFPSMPLSAINNVQVDYRVPLSEIAPLLVRLTSEPAEENGASAMSDQMEIEIKFAKKGGPGNEDVERLGDLSGFTCPECHGSLWQMHEGGILRFRCRTGHAYTAQALLADLSESVEIMLWNVMRGLEESSVLIEHIGQHLQQKGQGEAAASFLTQAEDLKQRMELVRQALPGYEKPVVGSGQTP
jgi:two-component system chemotaxis response regulator CheB